MKKQRGSNLYALIHKFVSFCHAHTMLDVFTVFLPSCIANVTRMLCGQVESRRSNATKRKVLLALQAHQHLLHDCRAGNSGHSRQLAA
jgi:hypothetical protein